MNHVIAGIDPGTTVGFAVLNLQGECIFSGSETHLDLRTLLSRVYEHGKPLLVGTDKAKVPHLVSAFSSKTGARIVSPKEDLTTLRKRELAPAYTGTTHGFDALCSAQYAFHQLRSVIEKVARSVEENHAQDRAAEVLELVVKHGVSRAAALEATAQVPLSQPIIKQSPTQADYTRIFAKMANLGSKVKSLTKDAAAYQARIRQLEENLAKRPVRKTVIQAKTPKRLQKTLACAEKKYAALQKLCLGNRIAAPIIPNLGLAAATQAIGSDVIVVRNAQEFSAQGRNMLADKIILSMEGSQPNMTVLDAKQVRMEIIDNLAFVHKDSLQKALQQKDLLSRIVYEYRKSRNQ